jgi:hypothetical protein
MLQFEQEPLSGFYRLVCDKCGKSRQQNGTNVLANCDCDKTTTGFCCGCGGEVTAQFSSHKCSECDVVGHTFCGAAHGEEGPTQRFICAFCIYTKVPYVIGKVVWFSSVFMEVIDCL